MLARSFLRMARPNTPPWNLPPQGLSSTSLYHCLHQEDRSKAEYVVVSLSSEFKVQLARSV